jgi:hypothetical protein
MQKSLIARLACKRAVEFPFILEMTVSISPPVRLNPFWRHFVS